MENSKKTEKSVFASLIEKAIKIKENEEMAKNNLVWYYGKSGEIHLKANTLEALQSDIFEKAKGEIKGLTLEIVANTLDKNYIGKSSPFFNEAKTILEKELSEKYTKIEKVEK